MSSVILLKQVPDKKSPSHRPLSAPSDSSGVAASGKQRRDESAGKEKSPSRLAAAQDRIRAKLIEISEQSIADVKLSHDARTSGRQRSPSPKRHMHVCVRECCRNLTVFFLVCSN